MRIAAARYVFITVLLDWLIVGIMSPVFPKLLLELNGGKMSGTSAISGGFATAFALVAFFMSPILGVLSDRYGRRPVILLSNIGSAIDCLILALAPNLWWLFLGRVLSGATAASATACAAYIADVTEPEKRAGAFGMMSAGFGIGFAVGPAVGGVLAGFGTRVPFYLAAGLMIASAAYGFCILPESLGPEKRRAAIDWKRANPLGALALLRRHRELSGLVTSLFCSNLAVQSFSVFVLYTIYRFGWNERANGFGLAFFGALSVVSAILVGKLTTRFGGQAIATAGFAFGALGFVVYGLAPAGWIFACGLPLTGLWSIAGAPVQSAMSRRVGPAEQGEMQGAVGSVRSIALIVGPSFFALLFAAVTAHAGNPFVGAPWFLGALLLVGAAMFALSAMRAAPEPEAAAA